MIIINSFDEYKAYLGKQIGQSDWHRIDQQQINGFADATLANQLIQDSQSQSETYNPFGSTISQGYLTISLIPYLWKQIADIRDVKMEVNYGIEQFRFKEEVRAGDRVRLRAKLIAISDLRGITKVVIQADLDVEHHSETAYTGNVVFLYHFN